MKQFLNLFLLLLGLTFAQAQVGGVPVKWAGEVEKVSDTEYNLIYKATIEDHFHLYSQYTPENGPLPTEFKYDKEQLGTAFELVNAAAEGETKKKFEKVFGVDVIYFSHDALFVQRVKLLDANLTSIVGKVGFMTCDDSKCIPADDKLTFDLTTATAAEDGKDLYTVTAATEKERVASWGGLSNDNAAEEKSFAPVKWENRIVNLSDNEFTIQFKADIEEGWRVYSQETVENGPLPTTITFKNLGEGYELVGPSKESKVKTAHDKNFEKEVKFFANKFKVRQKVKFTAPEATVNVEVEHLTCSNEKRCMPAITTYKFTYKDNALVLDEIVQPSYTEEGGEKVEEGKKVGGEEKESKGLLTIFFLSFLAGFAALLTPCVFPMIPMTVSFFTKQSKTKATGIRNAIIYGLSIIIIYIGLGAGVSYFFGAEFMNELSTGVVFNLVFFVILVVFAFSFMGAFEIMLPNSWANKVDRKADKGGVIGIFFMALALAIVSFSCTGPIVGSLLVEAATKGFLAPIVGMFGFSFALALPFTLFAMFPGWLNSMPKSGGWLNSVKVFLGFLELALAFKFLSNADLVVQGHYLERELFLSIWIAIFGTLALYLFGKIQLPHDSPIQRLSVGRAMLGVLVLTFTVYLIPGLWGAPLKLISGLPPSPTYSESPYGVGYTKGGSGGAADAHASLPEGAHEGPHGIAAFHDYDKGMAYAKKVKKPVLLDFTGHACVNCRRMEDNVWSEDPILSKLKKDFVLISLYVDDKTELPISEQYVSETTGKEIETIGNKWSDLEYKKYQKLSQPYYAILDLEENDLVTPRGYTPNVEEYSDWMKEGIEKFKKH